MGNLASKADVDANAKTINATIQRIQSELNNQIQSSLMNYPTAADVNKQITDTKLMFATEYAKSSDVESKYAKVQDVQSLANKQNSMSEGLQTQLKSLQDWTTTEIQKALPTLTDAQVSSLATKMLADNTLVSKLIASVKTNDINFEKAVTATGIFTANGDAILNKGARLPFAAHLQLGADIPVGSTNGQREVSAGQIGYNIHGGTSERPHVAIVGAGKSGQSRKVKMWDELNVTGPVSMGVDGNDGKFYLNPGADNWLRLQDKSGAYGDKGLALDNVWIGKALAMNDKDLRIRGLGDACHGIKFGLYDHQVDGPVVRANGAGGLAREGCDGKGKLNMQWDGQGVWGGPYFVKFGNGRCLDAGQWVPGASGSGECKPGNGQQAWDYNFATGHVRWHKNNRCITADGDPWSLQTCDLGNHKQAFSKINGGALQGWWGNCVDVGNANKSFTCKAWSSDAAAASNQVTTMYPFS